jgi:hypothetical protein
VSKRFFVYVHRKSDAGEIFYVGKGTTKKGYPFARAYDEKKRNIHWQRIVARHQFFAEVVMSFDEEELAFELERSLISYFGRANLGGLLCNIETGGQGHSGRVVSEETRKKMSEAAKGRVKSEEHRRKLSVAHLGKKIDPAVARAHSIRMSGPGNPNFGKKQSAETIAKRVATRGSKCSGADHPFFGKTRPDHIKQRPREANSKRVRSADTGEVFASLSDAASRFGVAAKTVSKWIRGLSPSKHKLEFV